MRILVLITLKQVRFVFASFEPLRFCKKIRFVFPIIDAAKSLRDAAKLEGHPERIGMTVYVNGLKKANYGLPGIREIDAFKVEE